METVLEQYTDLYDFAPVGYFTLGCDGAIRAANLTGAGLLGIERSRLIGRQFEKFIAVADRPAFATFLVKVFMSPNKQACEVALRKEGDFPHFAQIDAVISDSGQDCRIVLIDITDRKRADEARQASEEKFRLFLENAPAAIAVFDRDMRYIIASRRWLTSYGLDEQDIIGRSHYEVFPEIPDHWKEIHRRCLAGAIESCEEEPFRRLNGTIDWVSWEIRPWRESNGAIGGIILFAEIITERRQLKENLEILHTELAARATDLEAANIELEAFNYSVSHDLRTPLTTINGYCQVVLELCGHSLDEDCREYIREMHKGTLRMSQLIDTLLKFSHITRAEIRREKVDLSKMAEEVAMRLKVSEPDRRVTFRITEGITADGDGHLLQVVLDNLIGNAWKHTASREETVIEFGVTEIEEKPNCFVRDNGPGFDMAFADKLFVPFQRVPGTKAEGHGIGLATVERIVKRHGGRVWAEGEPGKGATFLFTLE